MPRYRWVDRYMSAKLLARHDSSVLRFVACDCDTKMTTQRGRGNTSVLGLCVECKAFLFLFLCVKESASTSTLTGGRMEHSLISHCPPC